MVRLERTTPSRGFSHMKKSTIALLFLSSTIMIRPQGTTSSTDPFLNIIPVRDGGLLLLSNRDLTDQEYLEGVERIKNPTTVNIIRLSGNKLKNINPKYFNRFKNLKQLYLNNNQIVHIADESLLGLPLEVFDVSYNKIMQIGDKTISRCSELKELNLAYNNIKIIESQALDCKNLKRVNITGNPITEKPSAVKKLKELLPRQIVLLSKE